MKCPICSKEIADDAKYCLGCGGRIPRCPTCNKVLSRSETFCTYDGTRIPEDVLAVFATPEPPKVSPATNNSNAGQQSAPAVNNNMNKNAAPKPPKSKIPVWILVVLAIFVFSSATLAFVVVSNMLVSNSSGKDTKKVAKNDDDEDGQLGGRVQNNGTDFLPPSGGRGVCHDIRERIRVNNRLLESRQDEIR